MFRNSSPVISRSDTRESNVENEVFPIKLNTFLVSSFFCLVSFKMNGFCLLFRLSMKFHGIQCFGIELVVRQFPFVFLFCLDVLLKGREGNSFERFCRVILNYSELIASVNRIGLARNNYIIRKIFGITNSFERSCRNLTKFYIYVTM